MLFIEVLYSHVKFTSGYQDKDGCCTLVLQLPLLHIQHLRKELLDSLSEKQAGFHGHTPLNILRTPIRPTCSRLYGINEIRTTYMLCKDSPIILIHHNFNMDSNRFIYLYLGIHQHCSFLPAIKDHDTHLLHALLILSHLVYQFLHHLHMLQSTRQLPSHSTRNELFYKCDVLYCCHIGINF